MRLQKKEEGRREAGGGSTIETRKRHAEHNPIKTLCIYHGAPPWPEHGRALEECVRQDAHTHKHRWVIGHLGGQTCGRAGGRTEGRAICGMLAPAALARSFICYAGMWHDFHGILTEVAKALMRTRICKSVLCLPRVVPPFHSSSKYCNLCTSKVFGKIACTARAARRGKTKPFRDSSCRYCFKLNDMSSHNPISEYTQLGCPQPLCAPLMHEN